MDYTSELLCILDGYLEDKLDFERLVEVTNSYKKLLSDLIRIELDSESGRKDLYFENGKAIGPLWAFMCVNDMIRTKQFIRGIHKAILKELCVKKSLHILYAGTGPFAALILPLLIKFREHNIKYTFIEVNPLSLKILKETLSILGLESLNISLINQDATKFKIEKPAPDLIISETLQRALANEQQVVIYFNLMRQVNPPPIFIPEKIALHLGTILKGLPIEKIKIADYNRLKCVFELSENSLLTLRQNDAKANNDFKFPKKFFTIKSQILKENHLVLLTEIQVYENEMIPTNRSSLTVPQHITTPNLNDRHELIFESQYVISEEPGLNYQFI